MANENDVNMDRKISIKVDNLPVEVKESDFYQKVNDNLTKLNSEVNSIIEGTLNIPKQLKDMNDSFNSSLTDINNKLADINDTTKLKIKNVESEIDDIKKNMPKGIIKWITEKSTVADALTKIFKFMAAIIATLWIIFQALPDLWSKIPPL